MKVKGITDEDFVNYRIPSMFIATSVCDFKCDRECGNPVCQNSELAKQGDIHIETDYLIKRYLDNDITHAIVFGGLEPLDQWDEVYDFIRELRTRYECQDPVVIYTGYTELEAKDKIDDLKKIGNIIVKFGRYVPSCKPHHDCVLGVDLASDNQYATIIFKEYDYIPEQLEILANDRI